MGKILALFQLLRVGNAVADPRAWAKGQVTVNALAPVIMALGELAKQYGVDMPLSEAAAVSIAGGVLAVVNIVCTIATHRHLGFGAGDTGTDDGARVDQAPVAAPSTRPDEACAVEGGIAPRLSNDGTADAGGSVVPRVVTNWTDPFREHGA